MENNWPYNKIVSLEEAAIKAAQLKSEGKKVVSINGSFDILHAGHIYILREAKAQGDALFVAINSDNSVRDGKGPNRPFINEKDRAAMVAAMEVVDYVIVIDCSYNELPNIFIRAIKPDIHVNGSEYGPVESWVDWPAMQEVGAQGYQVERQPGLATSDLVKKIIDSAQ